MATRTRSKKTSKTRAKNPGEKPEKDDAVPLAQEVSILKDLESGKLQAKELISTTASIKPSGKDAESLKRKKSRKKGKRGKKAKPLSDLDGDLTKLKTRHYLELIMPLHVELLKFQNWVKEEKLRVIAIFEGRDAAGKEARSSDLSST